MTDLPELFGSMVFNETAMQERLPHDTYKALKKHLEDGTPLDRGIADIVANARDKRHALEEYFEERLNAQKEEA